LRLLKSKRFWGLLLTVGLLVYCFYDFDFSGVVKAISDVNFWYLIPLLFFEACIAFIRAVRLKYIIDPSKKIKAWDLYPIYCIGMMTNLLMPYLTGQVARIFLLSKKGRLKKTFLVSTTVLEVIFDGLALLGISLAISLFFVLPDEFRAWHFFALGGVILLLTASLFWLSHRRGKSGGILNRFIGALPPRLGKKVGELQHSFLSGLQTLKSSRHLLVVSLLSVLSWVAQTAMVYLLILAFGFKVSVWGAVIITTVVTLMMTIVLSPANIGTFQAATLTALRPFDIEKSAALAFSFLMHIAIYLPPIILGAIFSFKEGLTWKQLRDEGEKPVDALEPGEPLDATGEILESR